MKKKLKVLLALVIIGVVAFGAFFVLNNGTKNKGIYTKVYALNNQIIDGNVNIYKKTNETISQMIVLINENGYNLANVLNDFKAYESFLVDYEQIKLFVEENSNFINKANTNPYFKNMEKSYKKVTDFYKSGYEYLKNTHLAITNPEMYNKDYIENFYNIFKGCLKELNNFYVNAGIAMVYGLDNSMMVTNKYKLEIEYYCFLIDYYYNDYEIKSTPATDVEGEEPAPLFNFEGFVSNKNEKVNSLKAEIESVNFEKYINNKQEFDNLLANKTINKQLIVKNYMNGKFQEYLDTISDEAQKSMVQNYVAFVIEG